MDPVHFELIQKLQPFFGNSPAEVVRTIVVHWLKDQYGMPGLRDQKAVR